MTALLPVDAKTPPEPPMRFPVMVSTTLLVNVKFWPGVASTVRLCTVTFVWRIADAAPFVGMNTSELAVGTPAGIQFAALVHKFDDAAMNVLAPVGAAIK